MIKKNLTAVSVIIAVTAVIVLLALFDPMESKWMPRCFFKFATGYDCPGCGSQRAIHALLHGDIGAAIGFNGLLVVSLPLILYLAVVTLGRKRWENLYRRSTSNVVIYATLAIIILWTMVRNMLGI
ncbi:MAG: DUF2752 domain-containing protein [Muribaculaceae bacterium]|nr:DUF2752 domain-containing protein [Muribaculaceae bacterium]MDE6643120.1 DUF2752 domain-containing protein [Muribaculaceae bacterium]